jgi:hypothetical protein
MIGPALFVATFTIEGCLRPGYSPREMFISELSLGPRGWIQIVNFIVTGVLLLIFTRGVVVHFRNGTASRAGPILLTIIGIGFLASGPFVMDPPSTPADQMTLHSRLHWNVFGALVFALSPVSCFVFVRRFRAEPFWRSLQWPTLAAGLITTASVVFMAVAPTRPPEPPNAFNGWNGAMQRLFIVTYLAWIFTFAWRLHSSLPSSALRSATPSRGAESDRRAWRRSRPTSR